MKNSNGEDSIIFEDDDDNNGSEIFPGSPSGSERKNFSPPITQEEFKSLVQSILEDEMHRKGKHA